MFRNLQDLQWWRCSQAPKYTYKCAVCTMYTYENSHVAQYSEHEYGDMKIYCDLYSTLVLHCV